MNSRAGDLIAEVHKAGGTICRDGDVIDLRAPAPLPADLVARIREAKPALLAILAEAIDWRDFYEERAAIREYVAAIPGPKPSGWPGARCRTAGMPNMGGRAP